MRLSNNPLTKAIRSGLAVGVVGLVGFTGPAIAQDQSDEQQLDRIEVVGSRIRSVDAETQQPVFIVDRAEIEKQGWTSVADVVQQLSTNSAAINRQFNNGGDGSAGVDLRGLGSNRTLVLVNGRRWVSGLGGSVDLNTIPAAIIERIEVLKDGASTIYGSDAIAGVLNIITRSNYDGAEANIYYGQFDEDDGARSAYDFTIGMNGDRGNLTMSASYVKEDEVSAGDREISKDPVFGRGSALYSSLSNFGQIWNTNPNGTLRERLVINPGGDSTNINDYSPFTAAQHAYNFAKDNYLLTPQERTSLYVQGNFDITDSISFRTDALYNERESSQQLAGYPMNGGPNYWGGDGISGDSIYNPYNPIYGGDGQVIDYSRRVVEQPRVYSQNVKTWHFFGGFDGAFEIGERYFNWDVGYYYNENDQTDIQIGDLNIRNLGLGIGPSFRDANGQAFCGTPDDVIAGCIPVNILSPAGGLTREELDYILFTAKDVFHNESKGYTANITGDLFQLPAGAMSFAAGYEHRKEAGYDQPDAFVSAGYSSGNGRQPTSGGYDLDEYYLELLVPILADIPFAQQLDLSVATRYSDYSNFGDTTNNKVGFKWKPFNDLMFRGNWSEGFRAPTISNLFGGAADSFVSFGDPCSEDAPGWNAEVAGRCRADGVPVGFIQQTNAGLGYGGQTPFPFSLASNDELGPENSTNKTLGLVYSPSFVEGFDISVDWYSIEIENAITRPTATFILNQCYIENNPGFCAIVDQDVVRDQNGRIINMELGLRNLAKVNVEGWDVTARYRFDTDFGAFSFTSDNAYISKYETQSSPDSDFVQSVGRYVQSAPTWRLRSNLTADWSLGDFGFTYGARYRSGMVEACLRSTPADIAAGLCSDPDRFTDVGRSPRNKIGATTYHDVQARWNAPWNATVSLGANNIGDKEPPIATNAFANSFDPQYDTPGVFYYAKYSQRF